MSYQLKNIYSPTFYDNFISAVKYVIPELDKAEFISLIFDEDWDKRELKDRMRHTTYILHRFFPADYSRSVSLIREIIEKIKTNKFTDSTLEFMFFPDYIETYGLDYFNESVEAVEYITLFTSCEFAVRPFIIRYGDRMIKQMHRWSKHENHMVRRLASEGLRPRLPWAMALPELKRDPAPILPVLKNLKNDPSEWVRKSVANCLNDISKDHPDLHLDIIKSWKGVSKETDAIIKHGSRTLLKQAHPGILDYYGLNNNEKVILSGFKILTPKIRIGESLQFSFNIKNSDTEEKYVRIEYGIYYLRQKDHYSRKVFKISERLLQPDEILAMQRKQSFKIITTRRFYPGTHYLTVIINGEESEKAHFELAD